MVSYFMYWGGGGGLCCAPHPHTSRALLTCPVLARACLPVLRIHQNIVSDTPKVLALRAKILLGRDMGNLNKICDLYASGLQRYPFSALLMNNVAVCQLQSADRQSAQPLFTSALAHATQDRDVQGIVDNLEEMRTNDGSRPYQCKILF